MNFSRRAAKRTIRRRDLEALGFEIEFVDEHYHAYLADT
jgi:hypothetical protein